MRMVESISKCVAMTLPEPLICVPFAPGVVRTEMTDADVPDATEWAVLAAPFILNLGDCPAKEDFNGTSVVGRILLGMTSLQCTMRAHLTFSTDICHQWPGDARVLSTGLHGGVVDSAKSSLAVRPPFLQLIVGLINLLTQRDDDCVLTNWS